MSTTQLYFPLVFFQCYLGATLLLLAFGPAELHIENPWKLYPFVLVGQLSIAIGYLLGIRIRPCQYAGRYSHKQLLKAAVVVVLAVIPQAIYAYHSEGITLSGALADPGAAYAARAELLKDRASAPLLSVVRALAGPVTCLLLPIGLVFRSSLSKHWQAAWVAAVALTVAESLYVGAAKGLFDIILVAPWLLWIRHRRLRNASPAQRGRRSSRRGMLPRRVMLIGLSVLMLAVGVRYFSVSRQSRYGMQGSEYPPYTTDWSEELYGIRIPADIEYPIYMVTRYVAHGYVGLSECLELPFQPCYGIGHSPFLLRYVGAHHPDPDEFQTRPYPFYLEAVSGYSARNYWHTIYPWLASDATFPGAILIVGMFGYLLARTWTESVATGNPLAVALLPQLLILFFYVPANNICMSFSQELFAFWALIIGWAATRRRVRVRHRTQPRRQSWTPNKTTRECLLSPPTPCGVTSQTGS